MNVEQLVEIANRELDRMQETGLSLHQTMIVAGMIFEHLLELSLTHKSKSGEEVAQFLEELKATIYVVIQKDAGSPAVRDVYSA